MRLFIIVIISGMLRLFKMAGATVMAGLARITRKKTKKVTKKSSSNILLYIEKKSLTRILFIPIYNSYFITSLFIIDIDNISEFSYCIIIMILYIISTLYTYFIFLSIILVKIT